MKSIISVQNLSKEYRLGTREAYGSLRDTVMNTLSAPLRRLRRNGQPEEKLWALKDINFEVVPGEVLGIVGRNGAGKSTLLKILSRITEPTTGRVELYGRVGSLLEIGTGFHPELTGRENIFLNGAILGMQRTEIEKKFDAIVAFAELEKFLDTPVKRYSSGMYMRLAFAVSSHLEPEILMVDEVLAVGDASFQKKCLGKMGDVAREGRTVLFVSHNMIAIQSLCSRVLWLKDGKIIEDGNPSEVVSNYLKGSLGPASTAEEVWDDVTTAPGNEMIRLHRISVHPRNGEADGSLSMKTDFDIEVEYWNLVPDAHLHITLHLYTEQDIIAFTTGSGTDPAWKGRPMPTGLFRSACHVPANLLNAGRHRFTLLVVKDQSAIIFRYESLVSFEILDLEERDVSWYGREPGVVQPLLAWTTEYSGDATGLAASTQNS